MKPLIHFAHANGVPSRVYQALFEALKDDFDVIMVPALGPDKRYPIDNHWRSLTAQVIESIVRQAKGRPVIGIGHSLGGVLTFQAAQQRPDLFSQVIMLDPAFIMGKDALVLHVAKTFKLKMLDQMSPAGLSKRRREHWESREQAAALLRPKGFYQAFDSRCFDAYIQHALVEDQVRGGVQLLISREDEVKIFETNPSLWWLPQQKAKVPMHVLVPEGSPFLARKYPQYMQQKFAVTFSLTTGGHMFPLEQPAQVAQVLKKIIREQS